MLKVTCAVIINNGKILAAQHNTGSDHPFQWEFPGGKINTGETSEECIVREIKEELEIEIEIVKKLRHIKWDYGFKKIELIPYLSIIKSGRVNLTEHRKFCWIELKHLNDLDLLAADRALINLKSNHEILEKYLRENVHNS